VETVFPVYSDLFQLEHWLRPIILCYL